MCLVLVQFGQVLVQSGTRRIHYIHSLRKAIVLVRGRKAVSKHFTRGVCWLHKTPTRRAATRPSKENSSFRPRRKKTLKEAKKLLPPAPEEAKQKMKAGVTNTSVCGSPLNPPPIEKCGVKLQKRKRQRFRGERVERSQPWGPYLIAPIHRSSDGVQTG